MFHNTLIIFQGFVRSYGLKNQFCQTFFGEQNKGCYHGILVLSLLLSYKLLVLQCIQMRVLKIVFKKQLLFCPNLGIILVQDDSPISEERIFLILVLIIWLEDFSSFFTCFEILPTEVEASDQFDTSISWRVFCKAWRSLGHLVRFKTQSSIYFVFSSTWGSS